jgi:hypothetical protein
MLTGFSVTWGQQTGVAENRALPFAGHWTGTGTITGTGDGEQLELAHATAQTSDVVWTGSQTIELLYNHYGSGDSVLLEWRTGNTPAACAAASWTTYTVPFASSGFVQLRVSSTL